MTNSIILSVHIFASGLTQISIGPTDPSHMYYMQTSTNITNGWDNTDGALFYGSDQAQLYYQYPPKPHECFQVKDLGQVIF